MAEGVGCMVGLDLPKPKSNAGMGSVGLELERVRYG